MFRTTILAAALASAGLATILSSGTASAQEWRYMERDRARLRYGIALEGGGLFAPGVVDLGFVGLQGQLGVQASNLIGIYAAPSIDFMSGYSGSGVQIGGALLIDFTLFNVLTLGIGPDISGFLAVGNGELSGGLLYGARLHLAVNPIVSVRRGARRHALVIGLDLRLAGGGGAGVLSTRRADASEVLVAPTLTIGFQGF